jgi:hypothetical protein
MPLLVSILYAGLRVLIDLLLVRSRRAAARDVELLALRHEVRVLRRAAKANRWRPGDRFVLAALSQRLARSDWGCPPVRPETVLRWHRELVRRKWAASVAASGPVGRRSRPSRRISFVGWPRRTPLGATSGCAGSCSSWAATSRRRRSA